MAAYEQTYEEVTWKGASVGACVHVGGFCIGLRARVAWDPARATNQTAVARDDVSVLATASRSLSLGRMTVAPELGLGVGRIATRRAEGACKTPPPMDCNAMTDPTCMPMPMACVPTEPGVPKIYVGDELSASTIAPRVAIALRVAVPLFEHVWLDALAGWTYVPFAHTGVFGAPAGTTAPGEQIALPGEPASAVVLGLGLRVGNP